MAHLSFFEGSLVILMAVIAAFAIPRLLDSVSASGRVAKYAGIAAACVMAGGVWSICLTAMQGRPSSSDELPGYASLGHADLALMVLAVAPLVLLLVVIATTPNRRSCRSAQQETTSLRASEERLERALNVGRMIFWEYDLKSDTVSHSGASMELLGISPGPASDLLQNVHPQDRSQVQAFIRKADESAPSAVEFRYTLPDGKVLWLGARAEKAGSDRLVGVTFDISDRKASEEAIWRTANQDALTGLPNRALFQLCLKQAINEAKRDRTSVSLLLIDLDDFKDVNDTLGHDAGDALLREVATRLDALVRECDTVARLGGDEFAVAVVEPLTLQNAAQFANLLVEELRQPFTYAGRVIASKASIGVAAFPDHDSDPVELMKDADIALYRAKSEGRNRAVTYSATMRKEIDQRVALTEDIREAIAHNRIVPFYQPKICLSSGRVIGFEALARWLHPRKGILTPGFFGAAFDHPELAMMIGRQLITKAAFDMRQWLDSGLNVGRTALNLSSAEFSQPGLADEILDIFDSVKAPPEHFEVEVTETVLLGRASDEISAILKQLRRSGVQVALDDFGTGYASLTHLKQFPVDHVKIDQSFVRDLEQDADDEAIVTAVIGLGRSLSLQVTAEGVETTGQALRLRELGCDYGQGYIYARPMVNSQVRPFLASWTDWNNPKRNLGFCI